VGSVQANVMNPKMGNIVNLQYFPLSNHLEWAPPVRVIAAITLFASTLDLMADFLLCSRLAEFLHNFQTEMARNCAYAYFFFTGVSILVYIFEITDVCLTLKNDEEDVYFARLAKSMVLVCEEVNSFCLNHRIVKTK